MKRKKIENYAIICIITVFMGQVYINSYSLWFRFSFAVISLSILLIYFDEVPINLVTTIIAVLMVFFRTIIYFFTYQNSNFFDCLIHYSYVAIFYLVFGLLFKILNIRGKLNKPVIFILSLWVCDSVGNIAEGIVRNFKEYLIFDKMMLAIILIGFIRSIATYIIYYIFTYYKNRYKREQSEKKYKELLLFISKLKTELFFLKKSTTDIENTMQISYSLYKTLKESSLKEQALMIAKNIHEIKKDYSRVIIGMEKILSQNNKDKYMSLKNIFAIIEDNSQKLIASTNKHISLKFIIKNDFHVSNFYPLISILNNLIINSIEAINSNGKIVTIQDKIKDIYIFKVIDNGIGIEKDDLDLLFKIGYSTKYDSKTGKMSTGIGLFHVKHIVENCYKGEIYVHSKIKKGTKFKIIIPSNKINFVA